MAIESLRDVRPSGSLTIGSDVEAARNYGEYTEDGNSKNGADMAEIPPLSSDDFDPYFSPGGDFYVFP